MKAKRTLVAISALLAAILACNLSSGQSPAQQPDLVATITAQAMVVLQMSNAPELTAAPAFTETPSLTSIITLTPASSLPADPTGFKANFHCTLNGSPFLHNDVHVNLRWQDNATNEDGYYVFRHDALLAALGPNETSLSDDTTMATLVIVGSTPPQITYAVQAFNAAGKSKKISKSISCFG